MTKSRTVEVNVTQSTLVGQTAQVTADNAASQAGSADSAALIAQSMANAAKADADSNYNYANSEIAVQSTATAKAQSTADNAFSQAQAVGSQASAGIQNNSTATAKAQSTADNAFSQATTAIDNGKVTSQAVTDLKDGSKLTIAELENGLATKVANSEYASYQTQTASQIASKVDNGAFSAYQTQTADLLAQKVATSDFSAYQATTAKSIDNKVSSNDFNTYKTQTADLIDDKVSSSEYASDKTQTASEIADRVSNSAFSTYQTQTASQIASKVDNGAFSAYQTTTADLIAQKVATSDFSAYQATTAKAISSKVESSDFNTYKTQTAGMIASKVSTVDFNNLKISNRNLALGTATPFTMTGNGSTNNAVDMYSTSGTIAKGTTLTVTFDITSTKSEGTYYIQFTGGTWQDVMGSRQSLVSGTQHHSYTFTTTDNFSDGLQLRLDNATAKVTVSNFIISESSKEVSWTPAPEDQATQSQITQLSHDINLRVTKGDLIDQINIQAGNTLISSSGQLTLAADTIYFDTKKPVIIPSANITGTLNGKTITGSTINGTTFNAGDISTDANNTNKVYPFHISDGGNATATAFNTMDVKQSAMVPGGLRLKYRATSSSDTKYGAYDVTLEADQLVLNSGYTTGKDTTFSQSVSGTQLTGQVVVSPLDGLRLYGDTQTIHFNGMSADTTPKGIAFTPYGNINATGTQGTWYLGHDNSLQTANFGIDSAGSNLINFYRPLFVDEIGALTSSNGHALLIHGDDNGESGSTGQMLFRKDSRSAQVVSASIYNRTYSSGSNVKVTSYGTLGRVTSASKYKLDITKETSLEPANKLLSIDRSSWVDKSSAELLADSKTNGTELSEPEINVNRHYGLIAEDLIKAGLDEFVIKGDKGQAEGIEYDRLWITLIPKIRQLSNENIQNKMTISKLESEIKELKQER
ncbi:hypothetical protein [Lactiplantibacillus pentosus]|uniref:Peptidase S74 domain-containing protein n=1 Tax=Lactiplantibacillus pentosus TaxID=1589 RepID=A0AAW8VZL4_LACPE|nr:hypothetical protein [Lactiplantibacillus pentosus]MBU7475523.1 hypothetical protein [Lactiplantibacillus pentosus]MBU7528341.1 hypothetical protein [Lactiplantibacillus pentosus]MDT6991129.1 hypothetical protein [Lactiplantibacillus pentosus]MDT6991888.1 hypothetical protein [Lactiplantibacillus pentosus]